MSNANKYLFLLTITPVQDFISQARKLKDLHSGSQILSNMSKVGIKYAKKHSAVVIFPQEINEGSNSYPNRFLIEISFENESKLKEFANNISNEILNYFKTLNKTNNQIIKKHIENFFQIYWSAAEYNNDYIEAFDEVEKRLAGAKNTRFFNQLEESGRKCSICGERNVAIYKKPMKFYIEKQRKSILEEKKSNNLKPGEGLCGVCYLKRISNIKSFDSTADIAIMNIPKKIREKYKNLNKDSQLFYEENLTKNYFKKNGIKIPLDVCLKEFKNFKQEIKDKYKQTSYYAVIMFDGDDMGKWLSGKRLNDKNKLKEFHQDISKNLAIFAKKAQEILKEPKGLTVYAGGEDFLGFVNINNLFEVLKELNSSFKEIISNPLKEKYNLDYDFTFSAGVVIAHYKTPLGTVLNEVKKSEKKAKNNSGKDSVCFTVLKRSGEIRETIVKHNKVDTINKIILSLKGEFSDNFIANLEKEFLVMVDKDGKLEQIKKSMITTEIKRLLKRSKKTDEADVENMQNFISSIYTTNFKHFCDVLAIGKFINREIQ